jgi:hypothetical protein
MAVCSSSLGPCARRTSARRLLRVSNSSIVRAKFPARHDVSSFRVEFLSSVPVVFSELILGCRSIFSYPGCVCGRQACLLP